MLTPASVLLVALGTAAASARVPRFVRTIVDAFAGYDFEDLLGSCGLLAVAAIAGRVVSAVGLRALRAWSKHRKPSDLGDIQGPLRWLGPLLAVEQVLPLVSLPNTLLEDLRQCLLVAVIAAVCWLALRAVGIAETVVVRRFDPAAADNLRARVVHTQMRGVRNVASFLTVVVALAFALMSFDRVRQIGTGLLASAGLAGVVLGFAAQNRSRPCSRASRSRSQSQSAWTTWSSSRGSGGGSKKSRSPTWW
jgi:hypothetical protein